MPRATADLEDIHEYIARDSRHMARIVAKRMLKAVRHLSDFPLSGRIVPELEREDVRELFVHSYRVIYRVRSDRVSILHIHHGARPLRGFSAEE
jgi:plasmid stabilization system protein ParE